MNRHLDIGRGLSSLSGGVTISKGKKIRVTTTEGIYEMLLELSVEKGWSLKLTASMVLIFGMTNLISVKRFAPSERSLLLVQADVAEGIGSTLRKSARIESEDQVELMRQINEVIEFMRPTWDAGVEQ